MPTLIRPESPQDIPAIRAVHQAAFPGPLEALLVDNLRSAGRLTHSLVAQLAGQIVGHIALSPVTVTGCPKGLGLAPLAVLPGHQRQGIAAALVRRAIATAQESDHTFIVVLGDPHYYARFGFTQASLRGLTDEYQGADAFQLLDLPPHQAPANAGLVKYAPEFSIFTHQA